MDPPSLAIGGTVVIEPFRPDSAPNVFIGCFIKRRFILRTGNTEVNDPHVARAVRNVKPIDPWSYHIRVCPSIWVEGQRAHFCREDLGYVERPTLGIPHVR